MLEIYTKTHKKIFKTALKAGLNHFGIKENEIEIELDFLSPNEIKQLNLDARGVDAVTDVLSFPIHNSQFIMHNCGINFNNSNAIHDSRFTIHDIKTAFNTNPETGAVMLGEVYICKERAEEQAKEFNHSVERELAFLSVHGLLHLLGFDHGNEKDAEEMERVQEEILQAAGYLREGNSMHNDVRCETSPPKRDFPSLRSPSLANAKAFDGSVGDGSQADNVIAALPRQSKTPPVCSASTPLTSRGELCVASTTIHDRRQTIDEKTENCKPSTANLKSGYVAILGRPNAGKSTLINSLVGEKVAIVSWKPQTTRNKILGVMSNESAEIKFLDTPGLHAPKDILGKQMMRAVTSALEDADAVLYVIDAEKGIGEDDKKNIMRYINEAKKPTVVAINKTDGVAKAKVMGILNEINQSLTGYVAVVPVSALKNKNIDILKKELVAVLPSGEREFDEDVYTDKSMTFMAAEIIREKALRLLEQEVPFGIGVIINNYEVKNEKLKVKSGGINLNNANGLIEIDADILCQNAKHKPIILGKGGEMIKQIATYARQDIERLAGAKVFLTLFVKVKENWKDDKRVLGELGFVEDK
jgi:GTP-binding protein Era